MTIKLAVIGIDHDHIFGMLGNMLAAGAVIEKWWSHPSDTADRFARSYDSLNRVADRQAILDDPSVHMILTSAIASDRAEIALAAMEHGKDVMTDKPGCTTLDQLAALRDTVARTGRIWTVDFSERFEVPAVAKAEELVAQGAIGRVVQTLGTGPHRQRLHTRPDWFFDKARYGGILTDIGSHQIDQFLHFTGSTEVTIAHALVENTTLPQHPQFQDFGEMTLIGDKGHGYIRVDWFTPDALPTWGDGRLIILGTEGTIELRKYTDIARNDAGNHLFLVNRTQNDYIDCSALPLPYFPRLLNDIRDRTETAVTQDHTFRTMEIAIKAQMQAEGTRA